MEAKSRIGVVPARRVLIALALFAALAFLAGGYAIRLATAASATPTQAGAVSGQSSTSASGSSPSCYWVNGRRGC